MLEDKTREKIKESSITTIRNMFDNPRCKIHAEMHYFDESDAFLVMKISTPDMEVTFDVAFTPSQYIYEICTAVINSNIDIKYFVKGEEVNRDVFLEKLAFILIKYQSG